MLPQGWTVDEEPQETNLPKGWTVDSDSPEDKKQAQLKKERFYVEPKSQEEYEALSTREKEQYFQELETQGEMRLGREVATRALKGATFGLSTNVDALKPEEFEQGNGIGAAGAVAEFVGASIPLSKLTKVIGGPIGTLAAKSPIFQNQISSLFTMFGVGATDEALKTIAQGEIPDAGEMLDKGLEWAALDAVLQSLGFAGRFGKALYNWATNTGGNRKQFVNQISDRVAQARSRMSKSEKAEDLTRVYSEIIEGAITEAEQAAEQITQPRTNESEITNIAKEAIEQPKITPKDLKTRKITDEPINKLKTQTIEVAEPYEPKELDFTKEAENIADKAIEQQIESAGPRAASEEDLGNAIRQDIETQRTKEIAEYKPFYQQAEEASHNIVHVPRNTAREAGSKLTLMSQLKTQPIGYKSVLKTFENALEDSGFKIQREGNKKNGPIELIVSTKDVPVQQTIELARRLNEMIDFEAIEPSVKNALRSVAKGAKADIRAGLKSNPEALAAFELAESEHARVAKKFSKDSITNIRGNQAGDKIAKVIESPSTLGDLKEVLSPEQMKQVERELLEKMNNQTHAKAEKTLREIQKHLSAENRKIAKDIVDSKNPHNPTVRKRITQNAILDDVSNSLTTGERPSKTLKLWQTSKGQKLVKETFHNSPNWPQVKSYLEEQAFSDMVSSVLKDAKLDIKKFKEFMRDPAMVNNIRAQGGEEAVQFFGQLDSYVKQMESNVKLLDKFPTAETIKKGQKFVKESPGQRRLEKGVAENKRIERETTKTGQKAIQKGVRRAKESKGLRGSKILRRMGEKDFKFQTKAKNWIDTFKEAMGMSEKASLTVFGLMKLGIPKTVVTLLGYNILRKMLTSPGVRRAFIEASKHHINPLSFILAIEKLGEAIDEETTQE